MAVLTLENIHFSYGRRPILEDVNHAFASNTFTAVLGTNGSGKTTLIRLLNNILRPLDGKVLLQSQDTRRLSGKYLATQIAYVQQSHTPSSALTVFDTVLAGRNPYMNWLPSQKDKDIVADTLSALHMGHVAMRDLSTLSGGQQQKVFLARALVQETPIIILDEPTANLDPLHQAETLALLNALTLKGKTIVMAIHDVNLATKYCTHFLMLKKSRVLAAGLIAELSADLLQQVYEVPVKSYQAEDRRYFLF